MEEGGQEGELYKPDDWVWKRGREKEKKKADIINGGNNQKRDDQRGGPPFSDRGDERFIPSPLADGLTDGRTD